MQMRDTRGLPSLSLWTAAAGVSPALGTCSEPASACPPPDNHSANDVSNELCFWMSIVRLPPKPDPDRNPVFPDLFFMIHDRG